MTDRINGRPAATGAVAAPKNPHQGRGGLSRMLHRQRAILSLLAEAGGKASRLTMTKWAFLLREEAPTRGGSSFYQFLPYQYGPYSFCLYQEAGALVRHGLVEEDDRDWVLTELGATHVGTAHAAIQRDTRRIAQRHGHRSTNELLDYVYDRYPWYTVNSKAERRRREQRKDARPRVYTAGYEGLLVDGFLDGLMRNGIRCIIDVRNNPVSRRYGYHKSTLRRLCEYVGIGYEHFPELGIHSESRQDLDAPGARSRLFDAYERSTLRRENAAIDRVAAIISETPSVLVCMEACADDCHRSRLANPVSDRSGLPVVHLELDR